MPCMQPERNYFVESNPVEDDEDYCDGFSVEDFDLSTWENETPAQDDDDMEPKESQNLHEREADDEFVHE